MPPEELARRVVYAFMYATARLADQFGTERPLKAAGKELQMAWFHALRDRGLKLHEISSRLGISSASVAALSKRLKDNFVTGEGRGAVQRRIEFMLWAEPLSRARLHQVLTEVPPAEIDAALDALLAQERVQLRPGRTPRFVPVRASRVVRDQMLARLDGLNQLVGAISQTAFGRFFAPKRTSFARVSQLRVRPEDIPKLRALYETHIWPTLKALDAAAEGSDAAESLEFVVTWSPYALFEALEKDE